MSLSWYIFVPVFLGNGLILLAMYIAQQTDKSMPPRHSLINGSYQRFLHIQDFYWLWSDLVGVALIINAFVHLIINKGIDQLWLGVAIGFAVTLFAHFSFLQENHKPDACYPDTGEVSLTGILHLPYFCVAIAAAVMCLWNLYTGDLRGPVMWLALAGGAFYILFFIFDIRAGNFEPLRLEPKNVDVPLESKR